MHIPYLQRGTKRDQGALYHLLSLDDALVLRHSATRDTAGCGRTLWAAAVLLLPEQAATQIHCSNRNLPLPVASKRGQPHAVMQLL